MEMILGFTRNSRLCQLAWYWVERYMSAAGLMLWAKDNGTPPAAPSPKDIMDAQLAGNRTQAGLDTQFNRWLEDTPFGTVGWKQDFNQQQFDLDKATRNQQYEALLQKRAPVMQQQYEAARAEKGENWKKTYQKALHQWQSKGNTWKANHPFEQFLEKRGIAKTLDEHYAKKNMGDYESYSRFKLDSFLNKNPGKIAPDVKKGDQKYNTFTRTTQLSPELKNLLANQLKGQNQAMDQGLESLQRQKDTLANPMMSFDKRNLPEIMKAMQTPEIMEKLQVPTADLASRQRVEDALMQRLNPYLDRDQQAMQNQLANQGLVPGSEAYTNAMNDINRQRNDARLAVIGQGGDEMARQFGMQMQGFQGALGQNQAIYNQGLQNFNANLAQNQAIYGQEAGNFGLGQAQDAQLFGQDMARRNQVMNETKGLFGLAGNVPLPQSNTGAVGANGGVDAGGAMNGQYNALLGQYNQGVAANNATTNAGIGAGAGILGAALSALGSYASS